jgi:hypothetical protein
MSATLTVLAVLWLAAGLWAAFRRHGTRFGQ